MMRVCPMAKRNELIKALVLHTRYMATRTVSTSTDLLHRQSTHWHLE